MATAIPDLETFLKELGEDYLSCTICLEEYKNPKVLTCDHTFCQECLIKIVEREGMLKCSVCDTPCELPYGNVTELKANFFMNSLLDIVGRCQPTEVSEPGLCEGCDENTSTNRCVDCSINFCSSCTKSHRRALVSRNHTIITIDEYKEGKLGSCLQPKKVYCIIHPQNEVKYYCETCKVTVCTDCAFIKHRTAEHVHRDLQGAADEFIIQLKEMVVQLRQKEQESEICKLEAIKNRNQLQLKCQEEEMRVRKKAEEVIEKVKKEEKRLVEELKTEYGQKVKTAEVQIDEWEMKHGNISSTCGYLEALMHYGSAAQLITNKQTTVQHVEGLITMETKPNINPGLIDFKPNAEVPFHGMLGMLCRKTDKVEVAIDTSNVVHTAIPDMERMMASHVVMSTGHLPTESSSMWRSAIGSQESADGTWQFPKPVTSMDTSIRGQRSSGDHNSIKALKPAIPEICASQCTVENIPKQLLVGESGEIVIRTKDSQGRQVTVPTPAVKVEIRKPDETRDDVKVTDNRDGTLVFTVRGEMEGRHQVTMAIGDQPIHGSPFNIPVTKRLVKTLGKKGSGKGCFHGPRSVIMNKRRQFVVADSGNNRIQVIDREGNHIRYITFTQFKNAFLPRDIAVSDDGNYFMTDRDNHQIVVSDEDGKFIRCFGQNEVKSPWGIAISPVDGAVYVTDWDGHRESGTDKTTHCIRKYTQYGKYITTFGSHGSGPAQFRGPTCLCISRQGRLYIPDHNNNRVQVFSQDCKLLYSFGSKGEEDGKLWWPQSVAVDKDEFVYVAEYGKRRVQKFDNKGNFICRIDREEDLLESTKAVTLTEDSPVKIVVADNRNHCLKLFTQ